MQEKLVGLPVVLMPAMPLWWQRWQQSKNSGHNEGTQHSHGLIDGPKLFHSVENAEGRSRDLSSEKPSEQFPAAVDLDDDDDDDDDDWVPSCSGKGSVTDVLLILFPSLLLVVPYN